MLCDSPPQNALSRDNGSRSALSEHNRTQNIGAAAREGSHRRASVFIASGLTRALIEEDSRPVNPDWLTAR